jgi:hypothetical protein
MSALQFALWNRDRRIGIRDSVPMGGFLETGISNFKWLARAAQ